MRVDVVGKHLEVTEAIRTYANTKVAKLLRFSDGVQLITVRLEKEPPKHFHAEVVVDVEKHDDFVGHCKGEDLYHCIDEAVDKVSRQLTTFKEKTKGV